MRCEEYLQLLSTLPVADLVDGHAGDHLGSCPDCNRATKLVVERERNMMMALAGMSSQIQPPEMARSTLALERRHRVGRWYIAGLVALLLTIGVVVVNRTVLPVESGRGTVDDANQIFRPQCLSAESAAELIRQHVPSRSLRIHIPQQGASMMMLGGTIEDLMRARSVLDRYDNPTASTCKLPQPGTPKQP
jgi:hypothetical protein